MTEIINQTSWRGATTEHNSLIVLLIIILIIIETEVAKFFVGCCGGMHASLMMNYCYVFDLSCQDLKYAAVPCLARHIQISAYSNFYTQQQRGNYSLSDRVNVVIIHCRNY